MCCLGQADFRIQGWHKRLPDDFNVLSRGTELPSTEQEETGRDAAKKQKRCMEEEEN